MRLLRTESSMMMAMWLLGLVSATSGQAPTPPTGSFDVVSFGAKADGKTDDTAAIQKALDTTGKLGGVVRLPAGKFLVAGSLEIPVGVALAGSNQAPVSDAPAIRHDAFWMIWKRSSNGSPHETRIVWSFCLSYDFATQPAEPEDVNDPRVLNLDED
jgi:Pectate lyase superfamily protein